MAMERAWPLSTRKTIKKRTRGSLQSKEWGRGAGGNEGRAWWEQRRGWQITPTKKN